MSHRLIFSIVVLALLCGGGFLVLRSEYPSAKDSRDLHDLTRSAPWPREELLVPEGLSADRANGWLDRTGFGLIVELVLADGREVLVRWQLHHPEPDGRLPDGVDCQAVATVTCLDLGDGFVFATTTGHPNSSVPATALYRHGPQGMLGSDQVLSATIQEPVHVPAEELRPLLTHTRRPTDAELLDLLRTPDYQTDWS